MLEAPDLRNHYSPRTQISLALPTDWREVESENFDAAYTGSLEAKYNPNLVIQLWRVADAQPDSYRQAAQLATDTFRPAYTDISWADTTVDSYPALTHTYSWYDETEDITAVQQQVTVQIDDIIWGLTFTTAGPLSEKYLPIFYQTLRSVRFISDE